MASKKELDVNLKNYNYAQSNDLKIAYRIFGEGEPLIVINGGPGRSSDTFVDLAKILSEKRKVILFDQRGTGKSKLELLNNKTITLNLMVEDLESLRKHMGLNKISILGHSFGGMYAMAYATKYPDKVRHLILSASGSIDLKQMNQATINIKSKLNKEELKEYLFWTSEEQRNKNPIKAKLEVLRITAHLYVFQQKFVPEIKKSLSNLEYYDPQINQLVWESMSKAKFDLTNSFKNFKASTLIIDGEEDFLGKEIPNEIHKSIPGSQLEILKECSHYPWLDKPKEYFALINTFLR
ncbi:MAG: alpha/beta fold hydrolase [Bdellovibrionota bacterium]